MRDPTATALAPLSLKASICGGPPSLGAIESPPAIASCPPELIVRMAVLKADDNLFLLISTNVVTALVFTIWP